MQKEIAKRDEVIKKMREGLELECGNRCAVRINPCNAREVLDQVDKIMKGDGMSENEYPAVHPKIWEKRVGCEPLKSKCSKCNKDIILDVPIKCGKYEGWTSNHLDCGEQYRQYVTTIKDPKFLEALKGLDKLLNKPKKVKKSKRKLKLL